LEPSDDVHLLVRLKMPEVIQPISVESVEVRSERLCALVEERDAAEIRATVIEQRVAETKCRPLKAIVALQSGRQARDERHERTECDQPDDERTKHPPIPKGIEQRNVRDEQCRDEDDEEIWP